ncbi:MAG: DUF2975 domain-containing protein [Dermatophilaceae bacterium]|nr:DUF2975 domain-containing protein [Actinomycetales bacterium]
MGQQRSQSKDRLAFTRADRIGLGTLLILVNSVAIAAWVIGPVLAWVRREPIWTPFISEVKVPALDSAGVSYSAATYDVRVAQPTAGQHLALVGSGVLWVALLLVGSVIVARLMSSIGAGNAFERANVTRLRWLAGLLLVGTPVAHVVDLFARGALMGGADLGGLPPTASISLPWLPIVAGLIVALIAQAFVAGAALRDDVEGLV